MQTINSRQSIKNASGTSANVEFENVGLKPISSYKYKDQWPEIQKSVDFSSLTAPHPLGIHPNAEPANNLYDDLINLHQDFP